MKKIELKINSVVKFEIFAGIDPLRITKTPALWYDFNHETLVLSNKFKEI